MENPVYVYIVSLGCSKNFVDTEVMAASLIKNNIGITEDLEDADICLINTCAFIPPARAEAEENIEVALDWKSEEPDVRKLIVSGCLIQWDKNQKYIEEYPEVDLWLGIDECENISKFIEELFVDNEYNRVIYKEKPEYLYNEKVPRLQLTPEHYGYVKIAEGCNNRCSYCAIPGIRGDLRSRNIESVVNEVKGLVKNGVKEILIIAQDITAFCKDKKIKDALAELLLEIDKIEGNFWIRLHYLHPEGITDKLIETIAHSKHVLPYLDIPIQHASDNILKLMNRRINQDELNTIMEKLHKGIKGLVLRSTFLVGFPGETEEDYKILKEFIKKWKFGRFGVFPFYPEPNTTAASMLNQVEPEVAEKRALELQKIYKQNSLLFNKELIGKTFDAIIDYEDDKYFVGRTYMDSPEIDNIIKIKKNKSAESGDFCKVRVTGASAFELLGEIC